MATYDRLLGIDYSRKLRDLQDFNVPCEVGGPHQAKARRAWQATATSHGDVREVRNTRR